MPRTDKNFVLLYVFNKKKFNDLIKLNQVEKKVDLAINKVMENKAQIPKEQHNLEQPNLLC